MSSQILEKIKPIVNLSVVAKFNVNEMGIDLYIPIHVANDVIYIITVHNKLSKVITEKVKKVLNVSNVKIKNVTKEEFFEVHDFVKQQLGSYSDTTKSPLTIDSPIDASQTTPSFLMQENNEIDIQNAEQPTIELQQDNDEITEENSLNSEDEFNIKKEVEKYETDNEENYCQLFSEKYYNMKIGEILIDMGYVNQEQIFNALVESKKTHIPMGTILVQKNIISLDILKKALTAQQGYDAVTSEQLNVSDEVIQMLPEDFIKLNKVIPISYDDKVLVVGMVNPNDKTVINDIIFLTGLKPSILIITQYEFSMCIQRFFSAQRKATNKIIRKIEKESLAMNEEENLFEQVQKELKDDSSLVVKFVNKIVTDAIDTGVSDIHIEPRLDGYVVRYRKDGILKIALRLPEKSESAILTRLKVISKMNIAEHRRPQDGSFSIVYKDKGFDFRINTLPVGDAEKMVIRVLAPAVSLSSSKEEMKIVGASKEEIETIKKMQNSPNGIILATGPTGSGKTTTLYTLLKAINDVKINITTIEDPIEIKLDGINQSQINAKAGITFASCMRAILRQDPDVILVGEIRDIETLETAISAALTGHLVLSTLHTNSAASTITRLIDMGAKDYLVSSTLIGIIAQRLVRHLCPHCRAAYNPSRADAEAVIAGGEAEYQEFMKKTIYKPKGCERCGFEGYDGRIGVYEVMQITKEIKKLIAQGAHDIQIEDAAVGAGMKTLQQACLNHILNGETTIDEFLRVLGPVKE